MEIVTKNPETRFTNHEGTSVAHEDILDKTTKLAVCVTDKHGNFVEVNEQYTKFYGFSEEELIGNHFTMVVPEEGRAYANQVHEDFIAGAVEMPAVWEVQQKDGSTMKIHVESIRMEDDNDKDGGPSKMTVIEALKQ
ncbi:MAG: PAS domain S-box protein [Ekhidna sp.]|nr:PAS domain S-box protein [Ekhidna sp.]